MRAMQNLIKDTNVAKNIVKTLHSPVFFYKKVKQPISKTTISVNENLNNLRKAMGNIRFSQQMKDILAERTVLKSQIKGSLKEITTLSDKLATKTKAYKKIIQTPIQQRIRELIISQNFSLPSKRVLHKEYGALEIERIEWIRNNHPKRPTSSQHYFYSMKFEINWMKDQNYRETYYMIFCLKCLKSNLNELLNKQCSPKLFLQEIEPKIIFSGKVKQQAKENILKRNQVITILEWYYKEFLTKEENICFHPDCSQPLHLENYILKELFNSEKHIQRYAFLINMNIEPVFMCCNCFNAKRYEHWEEGIQ